VEWWAHQREQWRLAARSGSGRPDASMSLLVDLATDALDPGYAVAAARRAARRGPDTAPPPPVRARARPLLGLAVLAATLLVVVAAVQTRASAPAAARSRSVLAAAVQRQSTNVAGLEQAATRLAAAQARLRDATLRASAQGAALARQLAAAELSLGTVAVTGPGLRVTIGDAPAAAGARNRVLDRDLQAIVNALWAAGAEAVSVNGERLTAQSAIRQAGDAVLVDFRPLVSPYVVLAVGAPVDLETSFAASRTAARMRGYVQLYGLRFGYVRSDRLTLPAAADIRLRFARPAPSRRGSS
jgi:uncharacterized protein YlxW (UPF0749 family)